MRDYAQLRPRFWTHGTGRQLRGDRDAQLVALYLVTAPHSNMLGLYYLPLPILAHETGMPIEGASKALARLIEAEFCSYDEGSEYVWVHNMAREQIGEELDPKDKRVAGVVRELEKHRKCAYFNPFVEKYRGAFGLSIRLESTSPFQGPSKPHRSQEQDQEQDQEQEVERLREPGGESSPLVLATNAPAAPSPAPLTKSAKRPAAPKRSDKRTRCPSPEDVEVDDWLVRERLPALASDDGAELFKFLNYHLGKGTLAASWRGTWATWKSNWDRFQQHEVGPAPGRAQRVERGALPPIDARTSMPSFIPRSAGQTVPANQQQALLALLGGGEANGS